MKDPSKQWQIAVGIPAYNESKSIVRVIRQALEYVEQVVVVDDGSADATAELASACGATVVQHEENQGKATTLMSIFETALRLDVDALVLLDGDGQHSPAEIPRLLQPILDGEADIVVGSRFLHIKNPTPFYRTIGQRVLNVATHIGSGVRCTDSQSGYRAVNRTAMSSIVLRESFLHGLAAESEMQFEVGSRGLRLAEVPIYVHYDERPRRSPVRHGFSVLWRVFALTYQRRIRRTAVEGRPSYTSESYPNSARISNPIEGIEDAGAHVSQR